MAESDPIARLMAAPVCARSGDGEGASVRPLAALALLLVAATVPLQAQTLDAIVRARLDSLNAESAFYAKQLSTGREVAVRADQPMNTASVIKLAVLVRAFRDADAGRLNLEQRYTIRPEDYRRGTGLLQTFAPGLAPTLRDLLTQMVITSDNTATDIMIGQVGLDRVNALLDSLGYRQTRLIMTVGQAFRDVWEALDPKYAALTDREVYEKGFPDDSGAAARTAAFVRDSTKWLGRTTAREIAHLLEQLQTGQLASPASTAEMQRILRRQFYRSRLPRDLDGRAAIGHKTGDWPPLLANDVGILYPAGPGGPIVIAVFTNNNRGDFSDVEATEGRLAVDVLDAWAR